MTKILGLCLSCMFSLNIAFADCVPDTIVANDWTAIALKSGSTWEVNFEDRPTAEYWLPEDDVAVCGEEKMIHQEDGEEVRVRRVEQ